MLATEQGRPVEAKCRLRPLAYLDPLSVLPCHCLPESGIECGLKKVHLVQQWALVLAELNFRVALADSKHHHHHHHRHRSRHYHHQ
jgi:hypothetical protein